jgi:transcriptional regulator of acetoin/glycerol metabolism
LLSGHSTLARSDFEALFGTADVESALPAGAEPATLQKLEKETIENALAKAGDNITRAAEILGLSRAALYRRLVKHGLSKE